MQWIKWIRWRMAMWACRGRMLKVSEKSKSYSPQLDRALRDIRILEDIGVRRGWIQKKDRTVLVESEVKRIVK